MNENTNEQLFCIVVKRSEGSCNTLQQNESARKKNRTVLLNQSMEKSLNLFIFHREDAGIVPHNEYLFALPPTSIEDIKVVDAGIFFEKVCGA